MVGQDSDAGCAVHFPETRTAGSAVRRVFVWPGFSCVDRPRPGGWRCRRAVSRCSCRMRECTAEVRHGILEKQGEPYRYRRRRVIGDHGDDHQLSGIAIHVGIRRQPWHVPNTVRCRRASRGQRLEALGLCRSFGRGRGRPDVVRFLATGWYGSSGRYPCR